MVIKRRDFQKAAAFIHEFLLKMNEDLECAELRDTLNLALLHMQKYYKQLQSRSQEKNTQNTLCLSARGLSPMTPFVDAPDKFRWRWINLDSARISSNMSISDSVNLTTLSPMIEAVKEGNIEIMNKLIKKDPAAADDHDGIGRTCLMYAVHHFQHSVLNFLLESGVKDINTTAHDGSTAAHYACHESNCIALSLLLDHGASMIVADNHGRVPLHWAVTTSSTECLELLLENNIDPVVRDHDGLTPCMWACRMDNIRHFELLCRSGYTVTEPDSIERDANGRTWMHWAVRRTEPLECLQTLLTPESAHYKDEDGKTVLMVAAEIGSLPAAQLIIEIAGTDTVDDHDNQLRTALHLATIGGHGHIVNLLLEYGADINLPDCNSATAWDYARNKQLHYCQLIIMSHHRQRMMSSNPTSPLPNGFGPPLHSENGKGDWRRMSSQSEQSNPVTPPHPPKRPRTNRMSARRTNSLTLPADNKEQRPRFPLRRSNSAGQERKKERIEVSVNTQMTAGTNSSVFVHADHQNSLMTDGGDMRNITKDVEFKDEDDIDNVSVGGMDVSDIEDTEQQNGHNIHLAETGRIRPSPAQKPPSLDQQPPHHQMYPKPPVEAGHFPVHPRPPLLASSHTLSMESESSQDEYGGKVAGDRYASQPYTSQLSNKPSFSSPSMSRPAVRASQHLRGSLGRGPMPSPPNIDPQRPHMIRHQQPLPPQHSHREVSKHSGEQMVAESLHVEQISSPPLSSQSSDQTSFRTQISVGTGPTSPLGGGSFYQNRPNSGTRLINHRPKETESVAVEGRHIPPAILTPLRNAPKPVLNDIFTSSGEVVGERRKKKKKKSRMLWNQEKEREVRSPPQNPLDIPPPRGFAAPLHPQLGRDRGQSAALYGPKYSKGHPLRHEPKSVEENTESDNSPATNGFGVHVEEDTFRSSRPSQRSALMEVEDVTGPAGDAMCLEDGAVGSIAEKDGFGELGVSGPLIPPPQAFQEALEQDRVPVSQSFPQNKALMRMSPTSAKPPIPHSNRNSYSSSRRSSEKNMTSWRHRPSASKN